MKRVARSAALVGGAGVILLALAAASRPAILAQATGGLWELRRLPTASAPQRICIADAALLAQVEHRKSTCTRVVLRDGPQRAHVHYTCTGGGFGQTEITFVTPRSFTIRTQGISDNAPFNYALQARRIGDC